MNLSASILSLLCIISALSLAVCSKSEPAISTDSLKVPGESPLEYCTKDRADDILAIEYFNVDPNPPLVYDHLSTSLYVEPDQLTKLKHSGQNGTVDASGILSKDIEEGAYVNLEVKYGPITIVKDTIDLCKQVKSADKECPLRKGPITVKKEFSMPEQIPNVSITYI